MQNNEAPYDVAVIGGGLAGLALAIQSAMAGHRVVLFEKEKYPYHKVCGEYISMEAWHFLESLGVPLSEMNVPRITNLQLSAPNGKTFNTRLPLGGFGISRFVLDDMLATISKAHGVTVMEETRVDDVVYNNGFTIQYTTKQNTGTLQATICCGSWGKRSNLDVRWKRDFVSSNKRGQNNYIGIKYHLQTTWPQDVIGLHNFKNGYCGISKIEDDKYCFCYLTTAENLKQNGGSVSALEQNVLAKNPVLKNILNNSVRSTGFPVTIAQISFSKKTQMQNNVLLLGDAAGMITPLCGNGMSMALHSSKIAAHLINRFLNKEISLQQLCITYTMQWNKLFANRLLAGRLLQSFFGSTAASNLFVGMFRSFPFFAASVIKKTHGQPF